MVGGQTILVCCFNISLAVGGGGVMVGGQTILVCCFNISIAVGGGGGG